MATACGRGLEALGVTAMASGDFANKALEGTPADQKLGCLLKLSYLTNL
jgi:hypothetical protein